MKTYRFEIATIIGTDESAYILFDVEADGILTAIATANSALRPLFKDWTISSVTDTAVDTEE